MPVLTRLYYRAALAVLPTVESHLLKFGRMVQSLDALTTKYEKAIEEEAVKLAQDAHDRRLAMQSIADAYARKEDRSMGFINGVRTELEKAASARDAVADFLEKIAG
jgi:hypothetical protein